MEGNLYQYILPTIIIFILLSPVIYRIFKILILKYLNRWRSYKYMEKTKNPKLKQKILNEAEKTLNRDYYLSSLIKNPSLTKEEINKIAMMSGNETRNIILEKHELPPDVLNHIANDKYISYTTWYRLLEQEHLPEETKVTLALSFPEYIKRKQDGIKPTNWDARLYAGF